MLMTALPVAERLALNAPVNAIAVTFDHERLATRTTAGSITGTG